MKECIYILKENNSIDEIIQKIKELSNSVILEYSKQFVEKIISYKEMKFWQYSLIFSNIHNFVTIIDKIYNEFTNDYYIIDFHYSNEEIFISLLKTFGGGLNKHGYLSDDTRKEIAWFEKEVIPKDVILNQFENCEVITGCMFAGKTTMLLKRIDKALKVGLNVQVFNHSSDCRYGLNKIISHDKQSYKAFMINKPSDILQFTIHNTDLVVIEEAQFFEYSEIIEVVQSLMKRGKKVLIAGLDMDYQGKPFGYMPQLMAIATKITKLTAVCAVCSGVATMSQRIIHKSDTVMVGAVESYEPRCLNCHKYSQTSDSLINDMNDIVDKIGSVK